MIEKAYQKTGKIKDNDFPYKGTTEHKLVFPKNTCEHVSDAWGKGELIEILDKMKRDGYTLLINPFGETGSVQQLHIHAFRF